jgi:hypothetical protein
MWKAVFLIFSLRCQLGTLRLPAGVIVLTGIPTQLLAGRTRLGRGAPLLAPASMKRRGPATLSSTVVSEPAPDPEVKTADRATEIAI